jgi:hypothetical protein
MTHRTALQALHDDLAYIGDDALERSGGIDDRLLHPRDTEIHPGAALPLVLACRKLGLPGGGDTCGSVQQDHQIWPRLQSSERSSHPVNEAKAVPKRVHRHVPPPPLHDDQSGSDPGRKDANQAAQDEVRPEIPEARGGEGHSSRWVRVRAGRVT